MLFLEQEEEQLLQPQEHPLSPFLVLIIFLVTIKAVNATRINIIIIVDRF